VSPIGYPKVNTDALFVRNDQKRTIAFRWSTSTSKAVAAIVILIVVAKLTQIK